MEAADPFDLQRFVTAQAPVLASALVELKKGRKRTHWMWFVFPQLRGLGSSSMATFYGIGSLEEARAYLARPLPSPWSLRYRRLHPVCPQAAGLGREVFYCR